MLDIEIKNKLKLNEDVIRDISQEAAERASESLTKLVQDSIKDVGAVATGELLESVTGLVFNSGTGSLLVSVSSSNDAVEAVENGLPPGTVVDINKLKEWMRARGLDSTDENFVTNIANKIYTSGIEPREPFAKAFNSNEFNVIIESILDSVVNNADWTK